MRLTVSMSVNIRPKINLGPRPQVFGMNEDTRVYVKTNLNISL